MVTAQKVKSHWDQRNGVGAVTEKLRKAWVID